MEQRKNLCAQIPLSLHDRVTEARELSAPVIKCKKTPRKKCRLGSAPQRQQNKQQKHKAKQSESGPQG